MAEPFVTRDIAETFCSCYMTDGFCSPANKPDCKCWGLAREVVRRIADPHNSVVNAGWDVTHEAYLAKDKADPRKVLRAMLEAKPND